MPKKKFIDRKKAVTFHLVHRSQQDPLAADDTAPQRVLLAETSKNQTKRIEEQQKYGIYFDDGYNYMQHLRESGTVEWEQVQTVPKKPDQDSKLKLPSSVFASEVEENVGLLNKAAPQSGLRLDLDPDVVAAMDDDFDFSNPENELEDNFIELANADVSDDDEYKEEEENVSSDFDLEERDEVCSLDGPQLSFENEETKSRFTDYSMSSSIIKRNKQLTFLDDRFEKMYEGYDENEIGALDCEDIEGFVPENSDILLQYAEEFEKQQARKKLDKEAVTNKLNLIESDSEEELVEVVQEEKEKWDCESILSTYSNVHNRPKIIELPQRTKIKINMKTGMPINENKLTAKALSKLNDEYDGNNKKTAKSIGADSVLSTLSILSIRPKDESPSEKKERKKLLKEYRKERRVEKKSHKEMFKENHLAAMRQKSNSNTPGNKIL